MPVRTRATRMGLCHERRFRELWFLAYSWLESMFAPPQQSTDSISRTLPMNIAHRAERQMSLLIRARTREYSLFSEDLRSLVTFFLLRNQACYFDASENRTYRPLEKLWSRRVSFIRSCIEVERHSWSRSQEQYRECSCA